MVVLVAVLFSLFSIHAQMNDKSPPAKPAGAKPAVKKPTTAAPKVVEGKAKALTAPAAPNAPAETLSRSSRPMNIEYGSSSWNTDSRTIDTAYLVMKDKTTGKFVQIQLEETEPDSSQFDGQFHVNLSDKALDPQVYVPPKELRNSERDYKKVHEMIQSNKLESKPLITKRNDKNQMVIDVYDTKEQAASAQKAWDEKQRLMSEAKHQKLLKQVPDRDKVKLATDVEQKAALNRLALAAADHEAERVRMDQIERQKAMEREKAANALSEKERNARKAQSKKLGEEAMAFYTKGEFPNAESKFREAVDLDPSNKTLLFRYGVSLYRLNKFNEAIVILKLAEVPPALEIEKKYFLGLTYYRLNELQSAKNTFREASASNDPIMGPSSMFYLGVVLFAQDDLDNAKKSFETVIDTSQDPRMDTQAEEYIERIAQALMFKKLQEKRWTLTGTIGANYDSNVTYSPDQSTSGSATKVSDIRYVTIGDVAYRAIYNQTHELSAKANVNLTNSSKTTAAVADPFIANLSLPYNHKGTAMGKGHVLGVKPAYETLHMAPTGGTKTQLLTSLILDVDNTFVMKPNWFSTYTVQLRQDDFDIASSTGDDDFDAMKYTIKTTQSIYLDKARKEAVTGNLGVVMNNAKGDNKKYNRIEVGANLSRPMKWGYSWNAGLQAYQVKYAKASPDRSDFNVALSLGLEKPIREWVTWTVTGTYTKNDSTNETTYEYSKYVIMTQAVFNTNL